MDTFKALRRSFDGDEAFCGGHQIKKLRQFHRQSSDWMNSNVGVAAFLKNRFPMLRDHCEFNIDRDKREKEIAESHITERCL